MKMPNPANKGVNSLSFGEINVIYKKQLKRPNHLEMNTFGALLSRKDSNLVKQNQNLLCYHYTTGQSD